MQYNTGVAGFTLRLATPQDCGLILQFIKKLALYEKMEEEVTATEEGLMQSLFINKQAEVVIGEEYGKPVGFALFFHNYSTFLGKANLYLEDLYIDEEHRGKGFGRAFFGFLAWLAINRGCQRLDWWCLDWNHSSIAFYKKMAAVPMDEWTVYRLQQQPLKELADNFASTQ